MERLRNILTSLIEVARDNQRYSQWNLGSDCSHPKTEEIVRFLKTGKIPPKHREIPLNNESEENVPF